MTPAVGYTEMKDSGTKWLGWIPDHWKLSKIGSLYSLRNEKVSDKDYPPLSVTMKGILPQLATAAKTDDGDNRKLVRAGDFVINSRSDRRGSCGISPYDGSVSLINTILTPRGRMHPDYYNWLFHTSLFADEFYKWGHGIVDDLWTTRWQEMKRILVTVPPYEEQSAIAVYLDTQCAKIDEIIAEAKASIEDYKQWKASIIYESVTKGLDPKAEMKDSGIEWIGEIPKGWNIAKAGMLFKEFIRPYCKGDKPLSLSQQDGLVPTDEMKESSLKTASYDNWKRVYLDDLVLNRFKAHLGVFFASRYVGCVSFHYGVYHAIRSDVVPKYYEYLFHSPHYKSLFAQLSNGITVGLQNLSNRNFYSAYVHFPDYETQVEIVDFLEKKCSELESLIVEKRLLIDDLEAYKKSLIYEVVTGKRRVC